MFCENGAIDTNNNALYYPEIPMWKMIIILLLFGVFAVVFLVVQYLIQPLEDDPSKIDKILETLKNCVKNIKEIKNYVRNVKEILYKQ